MRAHIAATVIVLALSGATCSVRAAESVSIGLTGLQIRNATSQSRSSAPASIEPANNYTVAFSADTRVRGVGGALGSLFPTPVTLQQVVQTFDPTATIPSNVEARNCAGTHPAVLVQDVYSNSTTVAGIPTTFAMTLTSQIDAANVASFSITSVTITPSFLIGYLEFTSGSVSFTRAPRTTCSDVDFNNDGVFPDLADVIDFFAVFSGGSCPTDPPAGPGCDCTDFNNDAVFPDLADVVDFLVVYAGGAC
jgi:hypothetical protein